MPIAYDWFPSRDDVIIITLEAPWTWQELRAIFLNTYEMIDQKPHVVYTVATIKGYLPENLILHFEGLNLLRHQRAGQGFVIGGGSSFKGIVNVMKRLRIPLALTVEFVDSVDSAIQKVDELNARKG